MRIWIATQRTATTSRLILKDHLATCLTEFDEKPGIGRFQIENITCPVDLVPDSLS